MGGSSSKAARSATGAASRKYPQRIPNVTATAPRTSAQEVSGAPASSRLQATRSEAPEVQEQLTSDTDPLASTTKTDGERPSGFFVCSEMISRSFWNQPHD